MRKLWIRRRGVSTMIGGIIVLAIFLTALTAMIIVSQQYDTYRGTVDAMSREDVERFSENLQIVFPGISWPPAGTDSCGAETCDRFTMKINNLAGIGTQIARIYVNSTTECAGLCVFDPAYTATDSTFSAANSFINPSEPNHVVRFWLAAGELTNATTHSFAIVTTRGRVFSFIWPFPPSGANVPSGSLYLGCLAINFDNLLVSYTSDAQPRMHTPGAGGTTAVMPGGWIFPGGEKVIFYVRISNICEAEVLLLDRSTFYVMEYTGAGTGASNAFYIAAPMSTNYYLTYFKGSFYIPTAGGNTYSSAPPLSGNKVWGYNQTAGKNPAGKCDDTVTPVLGGGSNITTSTNPCYVLPPAPTGGQSASVYVLFSANDPCYSAQSTCTDDGRTAANGIQGSIPGTYVVFLAMYWECFNGSDPNCANNYGFGVTLPFITIQTCDATPTDKCP